MNTQPVANEKSSRWLWRYGPLVAWMALIWFASSAQFSAGNTSPLIATVIRWFAPDISETGLAVVQLIIRKLAHFCEYGVLAFLAARAFVGSSHEGLRKRWFFWSLLLVVVYALLDEYHQSFVPSRTASFTDSLVDIAGGLTVLLLYERRQHRRSNAESKRKNPRPLV